MRSMLLTLLYTCLAFSSLGEFELFHSNAHVQLMLSSLNGCLLNARVFIARLTKSTQSFMNTRCWIHREILSGQTHDSK
jgi:hypothetical protein